MDKGRLHKAIHEALRNWRLPTHDGLEIFANLVTPQKFGFKPKMPLIDARIAIDNMLSYYIYQLSRLQPELAHLLFRRFAQKESARQIAYSMHISEDHLNRSQRDAIDFLVNIILEEELRHS